MKNNIFHRLGANKRLFNLITICLIILCQCSCKKYLEVKPNKNEVVPNNLEHLEALLKNEQALNNLSPALLEMLSDNYYVTLEDWSLLLSIEGLNSQSLHYIWDANAIPFKESWIDSYQKPIYISNLVLDYLPLVEIQNGEQFMAQEIKARALFYRANAFYELAQVYCKPYHSAGKSDPGLALRTTSDINVRLGRASIQESYDRILNDLKEAASILPLKVKHLSEPSRAAAFGLLARVYLSMRDYNNAWHYANLGLQLHPELMDYNTLVPVKSPPISSFNSEVIYHAKAGPADIMASFSAKIDSNLYKSYNINDLRKTIYFQANDGDNTGSYAFRGSYHGSQNPGNVFTGITTSELYLIRAECFARQGSISDAMADLNLLMKNRWKASEWIPFSAVSTEDALEKVLEERRKELVFRGQRWSDLRRFNLEGRNITLKRILGKNTYSLPPNDLRWVCLIPNEVINLSGIEQNAR